MGATVAYQLLLIALIFVRPTWRPPGTQSTNGHWALRLDHAFLISALSYRALFAMLRAQLRGAMGRVGLGLLLLCVMGAAGVELFTTDPIPCTSRYPPEAHFM